MDEGFQRAAEGRGNAQGEGRRQSTGREGGVVRVGERFQALKMAEPRVHNGIKAEKGGLNSSKTALKRLLDCNLGTKA